MKTRLKESERGGGGIPKAFKGFRRRDPQTGLLKSQSQITSGQVVCLCVCDGCVASLKQHHYVWGFFVGIVVSVPIGVCYTLCVFVYLQIYLYSFVS